MYNWQAICNQLLAKKTHQFIFRIIKLQTLRIGLCLVPAQTQRNDCTQFFFIVRYSSASYRISPSNVGNKRRQLHCNYAPVALQKPWRPPTATIRDAPAQVHYCGTRKALQHPLLSMRTRGDALTGSTKGKRDVDNFRGIGN